MEQLPFMLYMFEFVVDDLVITRNNLCAPVEYPTCVEITFRSNVYVNICDKDYGSCVNSGAPQCGKRCIFALETPITKKDRLLIHVYKKKSEKCKFLIGLAEVEVKELFENAQQRTSGKQLIKEHLNGMPRFKQNRAHEHMDKERDHCYNTGHHETWCPGSDISKRLVPLFNLCKQQSGNIVLIMRLVCQGPTIIAEFPYYACNEKQLCSDDEDEFDRDCPTVPCKSQCPRNLQRRVHG